MRRIQCLFLISATILLGFTRCDGGKDDENLTERQTEQLDDATRITLYWDFYKDVFYLKKYENGKEAASVKFNSIYADVEFGYGKSQNFKHFPIRFYVFSNTIAVVNANEIDRPSSLYVDIYNHDLVKTNGFNVNKTEDHVMEFWQWGCDNIIIYALDRFYYPTGEGDAYLLRYTQDGVFRKEESTENSVIVPSSVLKHPLNDYEYIYARPENAFRGSIKHTTESITWVKKYSDFVENNPGSGSNLPTVTMTDYRVENDTLSVDVAITYYNGETGTDTLCFDITNGQLIE